jgi:hypothetical protein
LVLHLALAVGGANAQVVRDGRPVVSVEEPDMGKPGLSASMITEHGGHRVVVGIGETRLETPPLEHLLFYAGLGVLVAIEIVELPVAIALTAGHVILDLTKRPGLEALGSALEEA